MLIDYTELPFPLIERAEGIEKLFLGMKSEVAQLLDPGLAPETIELPAMYLEDVADTGIPAEHSVKNVVKIGQFQRVRNGYKPDNHWVNVAENRTQD